MYNKSIVLVGMPGAGKTTIGKLLAKELKLGFKDSDEEVIKIYQDSIKNIFLQEGEESFREKEYLVLKDLLNSNSNIIIAAGGGAFINKKSRDILLRKAVTISLNLSYSLLAQRIEMNKERPLIKTLESIKKLYIKRESIYKKADLNINCDNKSKIQIVNEIKAII